MGLIRFLRGAKLLGQTLEMPGKSLVEHAYEANVEIPTNCTSGNCGSCMVTLLSGEVSLPDPLTPGLDEEIVEEGARLGCIGIPKGDVDIDILPPIQVIIMDVPLWVWALNIIGVVSAVWFLSWRLKSKLAEVEERHVVSGIKHRKRLDESD